MRSFFQAGETFCCFTCGSMDCKGGAKCPKKGLPKDEWAAHIAMRKMDQRTATFVQMGSEEEEANKHVGAMTQPTAINDQDAPSWMSSCNCFVAQTPTVEMFHKSWSLDNQSGDHLAKNKALVGQVEELPRNQHSRIHTNVGNKALTKKAPLRDAGKVWFDECALANVLSFAKLRDDPRHHLSHKCEPDECHVHFIPTGRLTIFKRMGNHCAHSPSIASFVTTVKDNKALFTRA